MLEILNKITAGKGTLEDLDELEELATTVTQNSLCAIRTNCSKPNCFNNETI